MSNLTNRWIDCKGVCDSNLFQNSYYTLTEIESQPFRVRMKTTYSDFCSAMDYIFGNMLNGFQP